VCLTTIAYFHDLSPISSLCVLGGGGGGGGVGVGGGRGVEECRGEWWGGWVVW